MVTACGALSPSEEPTGHRQSEFGSTEGDPNRLGRSNRLPNSLTKRYGLSVLSHTMKSEIYSCAGLCGRPSSNPQAGQH